MNKYGLAFLGALWAILIIGIMIGVFIGSSLKTCPQIRVGSETTTVTIIKHDTIHTEKTVKDIQVIQRFDTVKITVPDENKIEKIDSSICYSFEEQEKDGAYIAAEICSDSLPVQKPLDLRGSLTYKPAPDSQRIISRIDTTIIEKEKPIGKDWKTWTLIAVLIGFVGYATVNHR
jgi:hypothetical protein